MTSATGSLYFPSWGTPPDWECEELAAQVRRILDHPQELPTMTAASTPIETVEPG